MTESDGAAGGVGGSSPGVGVGGNPDADRAGRADRGGPPVAAAAGDIAGLLVFFRWMEGSAQRWQRSPRTIDGFCGAWRAVGYRLGIAVDTAVAGVDPVEVRGRCVAARLGEATADMYRSRMAISARLYQRWLSGDPDWWVRRNVQHPRRSSGHRPAVLPSATATVGFPLRPHLTISVEVPYDLCRSEVDLLHAWLLTRIHG